MGLNFGQGKIVVAASLYLRVLVVLVFTICCGKVAGQRFTPSVMAGEKAGGYRWSKTWRPSIFQGGHRHHDYYEGWYFKCVSLDSQLSFAVIPGIAMGYKGHGAEAFIQYIDGKTAATKWFTFPASAFSYSQKRLAVRIGENYFAEDSLHVDVGSGEEHLQMDLRLTQLTPWKVKPFSPGIMGWYRFVPGMETCHGLVSLDHRVDGSLGIGGKTVVLSAAKGYIEKDWGSSFPRSYVRMQSNQFGQDSVSFMCSVATIPYLGKYFTGFLGFLYVHGQMYPFATYTHAHLQQMKISENTVSFTIQSRKWRILVEASRRSSGELKAPQAGEMQRRISESIDAVIQLQLIDREGKVLFKGIGTEAGLEIVGNTAELN